jgi:hypothetical protein
VREVSEPTHELSRQLVEFWRSRRADGRLLTRAEIPSHEISHLMGNLYLASPADEEGSDWQFRLSGEVLTARFGGTPSGQKVSESHDPAQVATSVKRYCHVAKTLQPAISRGRFLGLERDFYEVEIVHLPILGPDARIWILGGIFFFN